MKIKEDADKAEAPSHQNLKAPTSSKSKKVSHDEKPEESPLSIQPFKAPSYRQSDSNNFSKINTEGNNNSSHFISDVSMTIVNRVASTSVP